MSRYAQLPGFIVLETLPVLACLRPGASTQLGPSYFRSMKRVFDGLHSEGAGGAIERRQRAIEASRGTFDELPVEPDAPTKAALLELSRSIRSAVATMPEVTILQEAFPGDLTAVPEWLRSGAELKLGVRLYWARQDEGPAADRLLERNVTSVLAAEGAAAFDRAVGRRHGYPPCCVSWYVNRVAEPPEWASVEPLAAGVHPLGDRPPGRVAVEDRLPGFFDDPFAFAFFAREFFPEPRCEAAIDQGRTILERLAGTLDRTLIMDYARTNFLRGHAEATAIRAGRSGRPIAGDLCREDFLLHLPFAVLARDRRYALDRGVLDRW